MRDKSYIWRTAAFSRNCVQLPLSSSGAGRWKTSDNALSTIPAEHSAENQAEHSAENSSENQAENLAEDQADSKGFLLFVCLQ